MKKLTSQNFKYLKRHAKREFQKKVRRKKKEYHGIDRILRSNYNRVDGSSQYAAPFFIGEPKITWTNVPAPPKFNLKHDNCEGVIQYINRLKSLGFAGKNLTIALHDVTEIGEGAIAMLLSVINELKAMQTLIRGTKPRDQISNDILERSGFFYGMNTQLNEKNINSRNTILRTHGIGGAKINLRAEVRRANETIWGESGRNPPLRGTIFEMMRNSSDHAFGSSKPMIWHLGISHDEQNKLVKFSFVDNGKGILNSLKNNTLKGVLRRFRDNADILETAFKNGIESRTGLDYRGLGLPAIYETYEDGYLENLVVISNDVFLDFDRKIFKCLENRFSGTYYYWIISQNSKKTCFND